MLHRAAASTIWRNGRGIAVPWPSRAKKDLAERGLLDAQTGQGPNASGFDPGTGLTFRSNGQYGTLSITRESNGKHKTVGTVTERTMVGGWEIRSIKHEDI
jgi:hypothetical protein